MRAWEAHGCLTAARRKALDAHLASLRERPARRRPGSYAWPAVRVRAERLFAGGHDVAAVQQRVEGAAYGVAKAPTARTIRRWRRERRWLAPGWPARAP